MVKIVMYTTPICPYCVRAKRLLTAKGVIWEEIDVAEDTALREEMMARTGGHMTVPQIFIGDHYVGGSDDLHALDKEGGLDPLLAGAA